MKINLNKLLGSFINHISNRKLIRRKKSNRIPLPKNRVKAVGKGGFYNIDDLTWLN